MNPNPHVALAIGQAAEQSVELAIMRRVLEAARGEFSLSLATCNSFALRDSLISSLQATHSGIKVVNPIRGTTDVLSGILALLPDESPTALFIIDLEALLPSTNLAGPDNPTPEALKTLHLLNASRDRWPKALACPVVLWLSEPAVAYLAMHAPDFSAWISHRFQFVSELASAPWGVGEKLWGGTIAASNLQVEQKHLRLAELASRIADAETNPSPHLQPHVAVWAQESGYIMYSLGDLDGAEAMHRKALEIEEKLGRLEGMANQYGNLGIVLRTRGDLDGAEAMYRKALEINEKLGRLEGMARQYGSLGNVLVTRGDLDGAEAMYRKSLEIDEKLGRLEGMANAYGNLGNVLVTRGDLDGTEAMYRKALEIDEKLGRLEGMASEYGNLGNLQELRGDLDGAREQWVRSRDLYARLGATHMVERVQGWIDGL